MTAVDRLLDVLRETIAWCHPRVDASAPQTCLRSPELRPNELFDLYAKTNKHNESVVLDVAAQRRALLAEAPPVEPTGAEGKLLFLDPSTSTGCQAMDPASGGYFDLDDTPPWDTWVAFVGDRDHANRHDCSSSALLVSWVPRELYPRARNGLNNNDCWIGEFSKGQDARAAMESLFALFRNGPDFGPDLK